MPWPPLQLLFLFLVGLQLVVSRGPADDDQQQQQQRQRPLAIPLQGRAGVFRERGLLRAGRGVGLARERGQLRNGTLPVKGAVREVG